MTTVALPTRPNFQRVGRCYTLNGVRLPSVSDVLRISGISDWSHVDPGILAAAAARGTAVHKCCEAIERETVDWAGIEPSHLPYIDAFMAFMDITGWESDLMEEPLCSETLLVAGTPDRRGCFTKWEGTPRAVLDLKTGAPQPAHSIQLAGYKRLMPPEDPPLKRYGLYLSRDGSYQLKEYAGATDEKIFAAAVALTHWKLRNGLAEIEAK